MILSWALQTQCLVPGMVFMIVQRVLKSGRFRKTVNIAAWYPEIWRFQQIPFGLACVSGYAG